MACPGESHAALTTAGLEGIIDLAALEQALRDAEQIISESLAQGWTEAPGLRFPTASGTRVIFLEQAGVVRQLSVVPGAKQGMVQMTQAPAKRGGDTP